MHNLIWLLANVGLTLALVGTLRIWRQYHRRQTVRRQALAHLAADAAAATGDSWWRQIIRLGSETGASITLPTERARLTCLLAAAGNPASLTLQDLCGLRALLVTAALVPTLGLAFLFGFRLLTFLLVAAAYVAPHIWLTVRANARQFRIGLQLPDFLDLMATALQAGGGFEVVLGEIAGRFGGPVGDEMAQLHRELALGCPFATACEHVAGRNTAPELLTFLQTLQKAHRHGVPLAQGLCQFATDLRTERRHQVRRQAAAIEQRISLIGFLVIFPACLLLVTGLVILNLLFNPSFAGWQFSV